MIARPPDIAGRLRAALTPPRRRAIRHGLVLAGLLLTLVLLAQEVARGWSGDPWDYWSTRLDALYRDYHVGDRAYAYSPAFAQAFVPFTWLPWPLFRLTWLALALGALAWLAVPVPGPWRPAFILLALQEPIAGNIHLLLAVALVLGLRRPVAWAFVLLTKVTPGVGLLWFAVRREWRALAVALVATGAIGLVSWLADPGLWPRWLETLLANRDTPGVTLLPQVPLLLRLAAAALLVGWGARGDRRWTVAAAATLALPHIWLQSLTVLAAIPRLEAERNRSRVSSPAPSPSGAPRAMEA